jgi:hypothetical protein
LVMFIDLPKKAHDLTGRQFGRLVALGPVNVRRYPGVTHLIWRCRCECGGETDVHAGNLKKGHTVSCGCWRRARASKSFTTHGMSETKEYRSWTHMIGRCHNEGDAAYLMYGWRGISVCAEWRVSFEAFYEFIGPAPSGEHSIDRIDNDRGYEPGNVRWATPTEQNSNKRNNVFVDAFGERKTVAEWARTLGLKAQTIEGRMKRGDHGEWALRKIDF